MLRCKIALVKMGASQHHPATKRKHWGLRVTRMFDADDIQKSLLTYLAEAAHELATAARTTTGGYAVALMSEAEELMTIRSKIIHRGAQLELPLEVRRAA